MDLRHRHLFTSHLFTIPGGRGAEPRSTIFVDRNPSAPILFARLLACHIELEITSCVAQQELRPPVVTIDDFGRAIFNATGRASSVEAS